MIAKLIERLVTLFLQSAKHARLFQAAIFLVPILLLALAGFLDYRTSEKNLTDLTLSRRESLAHLASHVLREKFDRIVEVGVSLATRVQFRKHIEAGRWEEAVKIMESVPVDFPYVDTVGLFDPQGTVKAITPLTPTLREAIGKSFAYRDYYKGVSQNWQPFVSEVFKRAPEPKYNVISVAIPIKSEQKILGILLLTVKLDTILDWAREIGVGTEGFTYFVDRNGHVAGHPRFSSQSEIVDFSAVPVVQKVLRGEKGVEVLYNPIEKEERVSAYEQVPLYGWGVIVQEPAYAAFTSRNLQLRKLAVSYGIIFLVAGVFLYLLLRFVKALGLYRRKERTFLEGIGDGVFAIDRYWNITLWNKAAAQLTGWQEDEVVGKPFRRVVQFIRAGDKKENIVFIEEAMLYGERREMENESLLITKDGREMPVGDSAAPLFDSAGMVTGAVVVFRDVSQQKEAERTHEEMILRVVHDLRSPATAIKGAAALYGDPEYLAENPDGLKEGLKLIEEANTRMLNLINELLESARQKAGGTKKIATDVAPVLQAILKEVGPLAKRKGLVIVHEAPAALPNVACYPERLREVVSNLIDNAIKYTPKGQITVKSEVAGNFLKMSVEDTGVGIAPEDLGKIFTPYFRAGTAGSATGTGLGLYIVKKLVEEIGGKIEIASTLGKGTTFTVFVPISTG